MNEADFEDLMLQKGTPLEIKGHSIEDQVNLTENIIATGVIIENCTFHETVSFNKINLNYGIIFKNCIFKKGLHIIECQSKNYSREFNRDNFHLKFTNTTIDELFFKSNNDIERGIIINEDSKINKLEIDSICCIKGGFFIYNSIINDHLDIHFANMSDNFSIREKSIVNALMRLDKISANSLVFTDSIFNENIHIWAGSIKSLIFNDGIFKDDLFITGVKIHNSLTIIGTQFEKSINFKLFDEDNDKTGNLSKIYIKSGKFGEQFIVNGNDYEIEEITFNTSKQLEGDIYLNSSKIKKAKISGNNYNSNIIFNQCDFNQLHFDSFYNYSNISIISTKSYGENPNLTIQNSNLGTMHLFNVLLDSFHKISIHNSVLTDIIIANVQWFSNEQLNSGDPNSKHSYKQKKEIYRQLKYVLEKQGNRIASLHFKGLEMKTFKKESFVEIKWYKRIFNIDRFVLFVGQTNDFGLNWFKPVLFAIGFSIFFHFLIVIGISDKLNYAFLPNLSCKSLYDTYNIYIDNLNKLPQLMNPTHILKRVFPCKADISFTVHTLDYLLKIILAFFIFQIISAFRKYIK